MLKVLAISQKELARGFALAGIDTLVVLDADDASVALEETIASGEYGIVIMPEHLSDELNKQVKKSLATGEELILVSIPGELHWRDTEKLPHDEYVSRLIQRAVGYQLNITL